MEIIYNLLNEVAGLAAYIETNPSLPYAHFAQRQAALATSALETMLTRSTPHIDFVEILPLKILRAIAATKVVLHEHANHDVGIVWLMLETDVIGNKPEYLRLASEKGFTEIVRLLLNREVHPNRVTFYTACKHGHVEIARLLLELPLERGIDPSVYENFSFRAACANGHTEIVRLLLEQPVERGVNPRIRRNLPLSLAVENGHAETVQLLVKHLAPIPEEDCKYALWQNEIFFRSAKITEILKAQIPWYKRILMSYPFPQPQIFLREEHL